jgi:hypothetical protein
MAELETQVAKIEIWDPKTSNAHVFLLAQNALNGAELYVLCELPLLNPAASEDTKRIALAIGASLKRSYRRSLTENSFESALADINEELGKLAGLGQTTWVGKLNSVVAVKTGNAFSITSSGKMTALLLRDEELNAIIEPGSSKNPLKTYENFSVGKLVLGDKVVLSTNQILNYLSLDRLKKIMEQKKCSRRCSRSNGDPPRPGRTRGGVWYTAVRTSAFGGTACSRALGRDPDQNRVCGRCKICAPGGHQSGAGFKNNPRTRKKNLAKNLSTSKAAAEHCRRIKAGLEHCRLECPENLFLVQGEKSFHGKKVFSHFSATTPACLRSEHFTHSPLQAN